MFVSRFLVLTTTCPGTASNVVWRKRTCSQASYSGMTFFSVTLRKKTGNVDLKMGPKIWTPFWGPRKEKTIRRTPKRGPNFAPHFRVHIAHVFRSVTPEKITCCVECLWAGSLSWQPHVLALGRTVLKGLVFGTLFSPHFGVQRKYFFSKETMLKPMSGLSQIQEKPSKSLDQI